MKKTQWIDLYRTIVKTRISFMSMLMFIMLGIGIFTGIQAGSMALEEELDRFFEEKKRQDIRIYCADGFSDAELSSLEEDPSVLGMECGYSADVIYEDSKGDREIVLTQTAQERFNTVSILEGRLPSDGDEAAVDELFAKTYGVSLGDTVELDSNIALQREGYGRIQVPRLLYDEFKVVGIVTHPAYAVSGVTQEKGFSPLYQDYSHLFMLLHESAYNQVVFRERYTDVYINYDSLRGLSVFDEGYDAAAGIAEEHLKTLAEASDDWSITNRCDDALYSTICRSSELISKLSFSLASIFMVISVLICYTTVLRIVSEQRVIIGTQKALGFLESEIKRKFVLYTASAIAVGWVAGVILGYGVIQPVVTSSALKYILFEGVTPHYEIKQPLLLLVLESLILEGATVFACTRELRESALNLLTGNSSRKGTDFTGWERNFIWRHLTLYAKTFIINLVHDKARVLSTLIGIVGCTALIVGPLTMLINIELSPKMQYGRIFKYNYSVHYDSIDFETEAEEILKEHGISGAYVMEKVFSYDADRLYDNTGSLLIVEDKEELGRILNMFAPDSGERLKVADDGIYAWSYLKNIRRYEGRDRITVKPLDGSDDIECRISGYYDSYAGGQWLIMTRKTYERLTDEEFEKNKLLFYCSDDKKARMALGGIRELDGYCFYKEEYESTIERYGQLGDTMSIIAYVGIALSVVMAFLVLLNLEAMFVGERKRELIVMRINGYSAAAAKKYIYRDNAVLTVIGTALGVAAGMMFGEAIMVSLRNDIANFYEGPSVPACLAGVAGSLIFALVTNIITLRPIGEWKLTDIGEL